MPREIKEDQNYKDKLLKLIPSEIVAAYLVILGILSNEEITIQETNITVIVHWVVFGIILILTPVYLRKFQNVMKLSQLILTSLSFVVWSYSLGGPFAVSNFYHSTIASILLILWTLAAPTFVKTNPINQ
ncbi:MAG: hypothetical protein FJ214_09435 [Ignavibacteria bacterium]|nr:hypothetical protein [Ignavibacteria bacterium]